MIISRSAEYALRLMAYIAICQKNGHHRAKDISAQVNVPVFYSSKILRCLVTAGLLKAEKGRGGGFVLARSPRQIKFIHIFEAVEGQIEPRRCVFGLGTCSNKNPCVLHYRWRELNESFQAWARRTNLADVRSDVNMHGTFTFLKNMLNDSEKLP